MRFIFKLLLLIFICFIFPKACFASPSQYVTIVNPVRGADFFQLKGSQPLDNVKKEWLVVSDKNLSATWLLRPDILTNAEAVSFFKTLPPNQELGLLMEVTPSWASMSQVDYHQNISWHFAGSVFLTGYEVEERKKLIDSAFEKFKSNFGYYPKSVGAWWIDANSLSYMREKYGVMANMDVADQFSTDNYQIWGQYFSLPFYPSKRNALIPAAGEGEKIGVVTVQWAPRDPFNSYGNGVLDSTYSVQANDYANKKYHNLTIDYFKKLVSIYLDNPYTSLGQVTVGLENDFSWENYGNEFKNQMEVVTERRNLGTKTSTMSEFSQIYRQFYSDISPAQIIYADDPLGSGGKVVWFQNIRYRAGWFYDHRGSLIKDLRTYNNSLDEPCLLKRCDNLNLAMMETRQLDEVTYGDRWLIDEGKISDIRFIPISDGLDIFYINQVGVKRKLEFVFNDVRVDSHSQPVSFAILEGIDASKKLDKISYNFTHQLRDGLIKVLFDQVKNFLIFLIFSILAFYLPGQAILRNINLEKNIKYCLSWVVGMALFTVSAFVLEYLKLRWGLIALPLVFLFVLKGRGDWIPAFAGMTRENTWSVVVILIGSISWLLTSVKNGLLFDYGLGFWGANGHDALWHLSLIENLKRGLPPENPIFSGTALNNYHYFYDLLISQIGVWTKIPSVDLYFRDFPMLITFLIGAVTFYLAYEWFKSKPAAILATFFVYFGGSFGWVLSYIQTRSLGGESTFWGQQAISTLINPPLAISFLIFLAGLYLFHRVLGQKDQAVSFLIPLVILWGSLIEFKAYGGILVLGGLTIVTIIELLRRNFNFLKVSLPIGILSLIVFLPNNLGGVSLLVFSPFWLVHSMVDFPDRLNFLRLTYARMAGIENHNWFKFFTSEGMGLIIFIAGNLGTRIVGLMSTKKLFSLNTFNLFILCFLLFALALPLLFIQKGANYNIIQFFYYFILIFNFLAGASLGWLLVNKKTLGVIVILLMILLTIPTTWDTLGHFLPARPPSRLPAPELEALTFLKNQPEGKVLSYYYDKKLKQRYSEPIPLLAYDSTVYVGAFSGKPEFISDTVNLEILGVDYKGRLQAQKDVLALREPEVIEKILKDNQISYLYIPKIANFSADEGRFKIRRIFENSEVEIFKVL